MSLENVPSSVFSDSLNPTVFSREQFKHFGSSALEPRSNKLKVASYCRVSSHSDPQEESLENQMIHYTNLIRKNREWQFAGIYSDRGKSGTNLTRRIGFNKMVRDAMDGKINLILCKSISRFARNVTDTINTVRRLSAIGVNVIFEKEGLETSSMQSEFILTMLSIVAQEESRSTSSNITWSISKRFENGEPIFLRLFGYKKYDKRTIVIVENEAEIVREAFRMCLAGHTNTQISKEFIKKGYKKSNGRTDWSPSSIKEMLKNIRYTGDVICQKTYTKDHLSHEVDKNDGQRTKYLIKNNHEPIIDRDTFDKVQVLMNKKARVLTKGDAQRNPLSGRVICGKCGNKFQKYTSSGAITWRCSHQVKSSLLCNIKGIKQDRIQQMIVSAFDKRFNLKVPSQARKQITQMIRDIKYSESSRDTEQNQLRLQLERALLDENEAVFRGLENTELTRKRIDIERQVSIREKWWLMVDSDDEIRRKAIESLNSLLESQSWYSSLLETRNDLEFLRSWVVRIKVESPSSIFIEWLSGETTFTRFNEGDD
jgi:DNA invertase Pin-like site-specific DNA recombinase